MIGRDSGIIFLVGFMGSGKSTAGLILAKRLGCPFLDIDEEIQKSESMSIVEIFRARGESYFREVESRILRGISPEQPRVVATGGGTLTIDANCQFVESRGLTVWLRCPLDQILDRCRESTERPLFQGREQLLELYRQREPIYRRARLHVDSGNATPEQIAERILATLEQDPGHRVNR